MMTNRMHCCEPKTIIMSEKYTARTGACSTDSPYKGEHTTTKQIQEITSKWLAEHCTKW
jgi:hypothetical protein